MDGQTNGWADQWMDGLTGGQTYPLLQIQKTHLKMTIFEQIWQFLQKHYKQTNGLTIGQTNGPTDGHTLL